MNEPSNRNDVIDSRDIIERIEELDELREEGQADDDDLAELEGLRELAEECAGSPDWEHGETLIRATYWVEYAQQLADDCGMVPSGLGWPVRHIDWEAAAEELRIDYSEVDYDGVPYYIRS